MSSWRYRFETHPVYDTTVPVPFLTVENLIDLARDVLEGLLKVERWWQCFYHWRVYYDYYCKVKVSSPSIVRFYSAVWRIAPLHDELWKWCTEHLLLHGEEENLPPEQPLYALSLLCSNGLEGIYTHAWYGISLEKVQTLIRHCPATISLIRYESVKWTDPETVDWIVRHYPLTLLQARSVLPLGSAVVAESYYHHYPHYYSRQGWLRLALQTGCQTVWFAEREGDEPLLTRHRYLRGLATRAPPRMVQSVVSALGNDVMGVAQIYSEGTEQISTKVRCEEILWKETCWEWEWKRRMIDSHASLQCRRGNVFLWSERNWIREQNITVEKLCQELEFRPSGWRKEVMNNLRLTSYQPLVLGDNIFVPLENGTYRLYEQEGTTEEEREYLIHLWYLHLENTSSS